MIIHTVKAGETLSSVARLYGVSVTLLAVNNSVTDTERLAVGQSLVIIEPTRTYTVRRGDTLFSVAERFGVTANTLYRYNLILAGQPNLFEGQTLVIDIKRDPIGEYVLGGYAYPFITERLLGLALPFMNLLMPFTYGFTPEGALVSPDDAKMLAACGVYGTSPFMHLSTLTSDGSFSTENATLLLADRALWQTLADNIAANMDEKGYRGLDIDFEYLGRENAAPYAEFIAFMREALSPKPVIVAVAPKTSDTQPGLLYEGHDYALLGEAADAVLIMTYEWGYTFGPPLAVSPIPNIRAVLDYAVTRIPPAKIYEGISNYGYDFTLPYIRGESRATSLSTEQATRLAASVNAEIVFDETALSPYFYYTSDGKEHVVWFEDARSIYEKLKLFAVYGLRGGLYWNLNRENNQNLAVVSSVINRTAAPY